MTRIKYIKKIGLKIIKYYDEPKNNYNIMSVAYFYMKDSYKSDINIYYNGLMKLVEDIKLLDDKWYLRIYFSLIETEDTENGKKFVEFIELLKKNKKVQMVEYFFNDPRFDNLIGTSVRFYPLFNFKDNSNINIVIISDIDITRKDETFRAYKYLNRISLENVKVFFNNSLSYSIIKMYAKTQYFFKTKYIMMGGTILFNNYKCSKHIFINFLNSIIIGKKNNYYKIFLLLNKYKKIDSKYFIPYGMDEILLRFVLKKIIKDKIKFSTVSYVSTKNKQNYNIYDLFRYYCKHNKCSKNIYNKLLEGIENRDKFIEDINNFVKKDNNSNLKIMKNNLIKYKKDLYHIYGGLYKYMVTEYKNNLEYFDMDVDLL